MMHGRHNLRKPALAIVLLAAILVAAMSIARADTNPQPPPLSQNWSNNALIASNDNWSGVPGIIGYRGDGLTAADGVNPATVTADGSATPVNVTANKSNPDASNFGGITEFHTTNQPAPDGSNSVVALQASGTADAPHLVFSLNTTNRKNVNVAYNLRDVDGGSNDAVQPVALQYRVGNTGSYTNLPAGYVADATTGPTQATKVTPISATLPAAADNKATVQVRVITTNAAGNDEWVGVDDISITGAPINTAPVSNNDSYTTSEDNALNVSAPGVLGNDTDVDGNALTASKVANPSNGSVTLNPNGSFTYTPNANFNGSDSFTYQASDGTANGNTATVNITVNAVNDSPNAADDAATTGEDTATDINAKANDSDPDTGQTLSVTSVSDPPRGTATVNPDGTVRYTPDANSNGTDTFTYTVCDNASTPACSTATVTVTVNPVNDAPAISDVTGKSTDEDTPLADIPFTIGDAETPAGSLTVSATSDNQTLVPDGNITLGGSGANRTVSLTPAANRSGSATITLTVRDGSGASRTDTFVLTVNAVNDAPQPTNDSAATDEDNAVIVNVQGNDSPGPNEGGQTLSTSAITRQPASGTAQIVSGGPDDGKVRYTPNANFNGSDSFEYQVCDSGTPQKCATATANVTVSAVNDVPDATDDAANTDEDTPLDINVRVNDTDADGDSLSISSVSDPANGTASVNGDGTVRYTPDQDFAGTDTFTYTVSDGNGGTDTATVTVDVGAVNDAPVNTVPGAQATDDTTPLTFSGANGLSVSDDGNEARVTLSVSDGALSLGTTDGLTFTDGDGTDDATMTFTGPVPAINAALDGLRYTPDGYHGTATLTITTNDLANTGTGGAKSDEDSVEITVNDTTAPDAPTADLTAASDTGSSDTDNTTSDTTPTISGTAEPNSTVEVFVNGNSVGRTRADAQGNYSLTLSDALSDGAYRITATVTDATANTSNRSEPLDITVDSITPDAIITQSPSNPTNNTTASFEFASEEGASFECRLDGGAWESCGGSSREYRGLSEGAHTFEVRATDRAGNTDRSPARRTFTVDFPAPPPRADLSVWISAPERVTQGQKFSYTLTANNKGPDEARNVLLESKLPRGVSFVSAPEGCTFNEKRRTVSCRLGDLGDGQRRKVKITLRVERSGGFELLGGVSSATSDPRSANSSGTTGTIIAQKPAPNPHANLAIRVDSPARITRGATFPYTITVANLGPNRARNTVVRSVLPDAVSFVKAPGNCDYSRGKRAITCRLGDLSVDERKQIKVTVRADRVGEADFRASVKSDTPDPIRSNDRDVS